MASWALHSLKMLRRISSYTNVFLLISDLETTSLAKKKKKEKHTTGGIPRWSPTLVLVARFSAYVMAERTKYTIVTRPTPSDILFLKLQANL